MQSNQLLHPQLEKIKNQLDAASQKAVSIAGGVDLERLEKRPSSGGWSIAQCLVHLSLSSQAEIEEINAIIAREQPRSGIEKEFKMDLLGRFLKWTLEPPPMFFSRIKTTAEFQPIDVEPLDQILPNFLALQEELKTCADRVNNLPLDRIKVVSPFNRKVKYNLLSFFHILLAHERRHLWQAEKVKEAIV